MIQFHDFNEEQKIAEISLDLSNRKIKTVDDLMNFFGDLYANNCIGIIIHKNVLDDSFFDLKTGIAGEILQKLSTYRMKLAIIGDFSNIESKSLRDFIRESNRRKFVNFVESFDQAIEAFNTTVNR